VVVVSAEASSLKRRFVAINVVSFVWSTVVTVIMLVLDRRWLFGLIKVMWAVVIALLLVSFWCYLSAVIRTVRTTAKALGVTWVRHGPETRHQHRLHLIHRGWSAWLGHAGTPAGQAATAAPCEP
jgi:hypothetical protein